MNYRRIRMVRVGKSPVIGFAAKELAKYLTMADKMLVIDELLTEQPLAAGTQLILKVSEELAKELKVEDPSLDDGYRICVNSDAGVIEGTNERSVLLGTYRFLRELGFAFVRPGKKGDRVPAVLPEKYEIRVCEKAEYRHRGVTIEGADTYQNVADMIDFVPKMGMNTYFFQFFVPEHFFVRWYSHEFNPCLAPEELNRNICAGFVQSLEDELHKRGLVEHKVGHGWTCEPFGIPGLKQGLTGANVDFQITDEVKACLAEVKGKRELWKNVPLHTNLCYSNSKVRETITSAICDYSLAHPEIDVIHFWLADGYNNHCECENCRKKTPSDWYVQMLNELDEKMTAAGSKTRIVFLLYVDLLWAPEMEKIRYPERFLLMFAPITRYYGENYEDMEPFDGQIKPYELNVSAMPDELNENVAHLQNWQKLYQGDGFIFDYHLQWSHMADPGYELAAKNIFSDMQYLHQLGLNGNVSCQIQRVFFPSGIVMRAMAEGLWSKDARFEDVLAKYYKDSYGDKGDAVREYLSKISSLFTVYENDNNHPLGTKIPRRPADLPFVRDYQEVLATVDAFLPVIEEGMTSGKQDAEDWKVLKVHAGYVKLFAKIMQRRNEQDEDGVKTAIEETVKYICENEISIQEAVDANNVVKVLNARLWGTF